MIHNQNCDDDYVTEGVDENDVFMFNLLVPFRMADARVQLVFNVRYSLSIC